MPIVIELRLKATWTVQPDTRQLHGLACALFETEEADHLGLEKPFGVWPLRAAGSGAAHDWEWRAAWLPAALPAAAALAPQELRIGHVRCTVTEARHRSVSHAHLAAGPGMRAVRVEFRSPAYFSQNGTGVVLPDPRLIAGSWRRRWNASLPDGDRLAIGDEVWRDAHRALCLAEYDLRTERRDTGRNRSQAGMVGSAVLRLAGSLSPTVPRALGTLARFAEFCGTGAQTTCGFGATATATVPPDS